MGRTFERGLQNREKGEEGCHGRQRARAREKSMRVKREKNRNRETAGKGGREERERDFQSVEGPLKD